VYASFVMRIVGNEDPTRAIWPSSPATGWRNGVDRLYARAAFSGTHESQFNNKKQHETRNKLKSRNDETFNRTLFTGRNSGQLNLIPRESPSDSVVEVHGPYQHGSGWSTVNAGFPFRMPVDALAVPPHIAITTKNNENDDGSKGSNNENNNNMKHNVVKSMGPHNPSSFVSEFGCSTMSSFESLAPTLKPKHWGLHGGARENICYPAYGNPNKCIGSNTMAERNYPCDSLILAYFGDKEHVMRDFGLNAGMYLCIYVSMYLCVYVSMYLCVYVSMCLCIYLSM
jgi:beta-mannosidase